MSENTSFWRTGLRDTLVSWFTPKNAFWLSCLSWLSAVWDFLSRAASSIFDSISGIFTGNCVSLNPFAQLVQHCFSDSLAAGYVSVVKQFILDGGNTHITNIGSYIYTLVGVPWWVNSVSLYISLYVMLCILGWCYRGLRWLIGLIMDAIPVA